MPALAGLLAATGEAPRLLPLLFTLAVLIATAKVLGSLAVTLRQPAVLGELLAGLLLGPTFLDLLDVPMIRGADLGSVIHELGQIGVILLMFAAGLEIELDDLRRTGRPAILAGTLGVVFPLAMGAGAALLLGSEPNDALFLGIVLSATSVSISAQTLLELGRLRTREGITLLGAAVIDDILVIMLLSTFTIIMQGQGTPLGVLLALGRMLLILVLVLLFALRVLPVLTEWSQRLRVSEGLLALVLAFVLLLAWSVEYLGGVAAITGAFLAGVGLARSHLRQEIEEGLHRIAFAFFVPLFLVDIGLQTDVGALQGGLIALALLLILVAFVSKFLGASLGALAGGLGRAGSARLGLGMISRGEVGLIVAGVGIAEGFLSPESFSMVVLLVVVTTLATPVLLRIAYGKERPPDGSTGNPGDR